MYGMATLQNVQVVHSLSTTSASVLVNSAHGVGIGSSNSRSFYDGRRELRIRSTSKCHTDRCDSGSLPLVRPWLRPGPSVATSPSYSRVWSHLHTSGPLTYLETELIQSAMCRRSCILCRQASRECCAEVLMQLDGKLATSHD